MLVSSLIDFVDEFKFIVFDFDGTLKHTAGIKADGYLELFSFSEESTQEKIRLHDSENPHLSRFDKIPLYLNFCSIEPTRENVEKYTIAYGNIVKGKVLNANAVDGAQCFIERISKEKKLYIASATPQEEIEFILNTEGWSSYFQCIYGSPNRKQVILKEIVRTCRLPEDKGLFIGDTLGDKLAAVEVGLPFLWRLERKTPETIQFESDFYIYDFME